MHYTVYKTTCLINNKFYIGVHRTDNPNDDYIGSGKYFWHSVDKYGIENFRKEILADFDNSEAMFALEKELVAKEKNNPLCMNIKEGGCGEWEWHRENNKLNQTLGGQRAYLKLKLFLASHPEAVGRNFRRINNGSEEHKQRARNAGKIGCRKWAGMHHKQETRKVMSALKQGSRNNQFGKIWIYSLEYKHSKIITKQLLPQYLQAGYQIGRKMNFLMPV